VKGDIKMASIKATDARSRIYRLIDEVNETHEPLVITGKRGNAVLISEEDWMAVQETLHLLSIPGMRESIRKGMSEPADECSEEPGW
jgi:prevent-host-death family protein